MVTWKPPNRKAQSSHRHADSGDAAVGVEADGDAGVVGVGVEVHVEVGVGGHEDVVTVSWDKLG